MKKFLSGVMATLLLAMSPVTVAAQTISELAYEMNKACPIKVTGLTINKITFANNTLEHYLTVDNGSSLHLPNLYSHPNEGKEVLKMMFFGLFSELRYYRDRIIEKGVYIKYNIYDKILDSSTSIVLTTSDLKNAISQYSHMNPLEFDILRIVTAHNMMVPYQIDDCSYDIGLLSENNSIILQILIDDNICDFELLKENRQEMKEEMFKELKSSFSPLVDIVLKNANYVIKIRYINKSTEEYFDLLYYNRDFRQNSSIQTSSPKPQNNNSKYRTNQTIQNHISL